MSDIRFRHWFLAGAMALALHGGLLAAASTDRKLSGAVATGAGGLEMSFGPAGSAAGGVPVQPAEAAETPSEEHPDGILPEPLEAIVRPLEVSERTPTPEQPEEVPEPLPVTEPDIVDPVQVAEIVEPVEADRVPDIRPVEKPAQETPPVTEVPPPVRESSEKPPVEIAAETVPVVRRKPTSPVPTKKAAEPARPTVTKQAPAPPVRKAVAAGTNARAGQGQGAASGTTVSASSGGNPGAVQDYFALVISLLEREKRYPPRERMLRKEGTVNLAFTIGRDGGVSGARIAGSSGSTGLDRAALRMLADAAPLPAVPTDVPDNLLNVVVPVEFRLR